MKAVEDYIFGLEGQQRAIINFLHHHLLETMDLHVKISYRVPMYRRKGWVVYLNPIKNDGVEMAFMRGHLLSN